MPNFTQQASDIAAQFMGTGGSASRPGSRMPKGLNVGNMRDFGKSPAGRHLVDGIKQRIGTDTKRARIQI